MQGLCRNRQAPPNPTPRRVRLSAPPLPLHLRCRRAGRSPAAGHEKFVSKPGQFVFRAGQFVFARGQSVSQTAQFVFERGGRVFERGQFVFKTGQFVLERGQFGFETGRFVLGTNFLAGIAMSAGRVSGILCARSTLKAPRSLYASQEEGAGHGAGVDTAEGPVGAAGPRTDDPGGAGSGVPAIEEGGRRAGLGGRPGDAPRGASRAGPHAVATTCEVQPQTWPSLHNAASSGGGSGGNRWRCRSGRSCEHLVASYATGRRDITRNFKGNDHARIPEWRVGRTGHQVHAQAMDGWVDGNQSNLPAHAAGSNVQGFGSAPDSLDVERVAATSCRKHRQTFHLLHRQPHAGAILNASSPSLRALAG